MIDRSLSKKWRNKKGTRERKCSCGTWKNHWLKFSGSSWPLNCSVEGCLNISELGGHIICDEDTHEKIVPMCSSCNSKETEFYLKNGTKLVSANVSDTCGKY
jgi:hypothetical protein